MEKRTRLSEAAEVLAKLGPRKRQQMGGEILGAALVAAERDRTPAPKPTPDPARLAAEHAEMRRVLEEVEWVGKFSHTYCPWCANPEQAGHRDDCSRRVLLARLDAGPAPALGYTECPGCSGALIPIVDAPGLADCARCGGLIGSPTREVLARFIRQPFAMAEVEGQEETRYFDVQIDGGRRVHGWVGVRSGVVTQFG